MGKTNISLEELISLNPHIKIEDIEKVSEHLKKLRDMRIEGRTRGITPVSHRHRITIGEQSAMDSRTIHLGRFRR